MSGTSAATTPVPGEHPVDGHAASEDAARTRSAAYVALLKPRIALLVVVTTAVGYATAVRFGDIAGWTWLGAFGSLLGTASSCMAAAAFNQILERRVDGLMPRTRNRPLPRGDLGVGEAVWLAVTLTVLGQGLLCVCGTPLASWIALFTIASYALLYTPLKRVTSWSVWIGAVPGALPPVIGYAAATGHPLAMAPAVTGGGVLGGPIGPGLDAVLPVSFGYLGPAAWLLFAILFFWQVPHFLCIAELYRDDYAAGGMPMAPVRDARDGGNRTGREAVFGTAVLVGVTVLPWWLGYAGLAYLVIAGAASLLFAGQAWRFVIDRRRDTARRLFLGSLLYLPVVLLAWVLNPAGGAI